MHIKKAEIYNNIIYYIFIEYKTNKLGIYMIWSYWAHFDKRDSFKTSKIKFITFEIIKFASVLLFF